MESKDTYGIFGGRYVPETLIAPLQELETAFDYYVDKEEFNHAWHKYLTHYAGRPTPIYETQTFAKNECCRIFLKREDLLHGGAHKTNNCLGQGLLAKHLHKKRLIAETGAGQHGVATAMIGALLGLETVIYMGATDMKRQEMNVFRMQLMGATVRPVEYGTGTLKDAINEALRDWIAHVKDTFYIFGTAAGPAPYPRIVRHFQEIVGKESKQQMVEQTGHDPDYVIACVGGGSNAIGIFSPYIGLKDVHLVGVEAAGSGIETNKHAATLTQGRIGVLHGSKSYLLQSEEGQILDTHSISAGLDYPGVGPEHSYLKEKGWVEYVSVTDKEAVAAFQNLCKSEGIIPALESAHALAYAEKLSEHVYKTTKQHSIPDRPFQLLVNCSGRGDKDLHSVMDYLQAKS